MAFTFGAENKIKGDKIQNASPMNSPEEKKCELCKQVIFEKEMYMICQIKNYKGEFKMKDYCCDCFKKEIEDDIERVQNWSRKTVNNLMNMLSPIEVYMNSETKKEIDANRKILNRVEEEGGL